MAAVALNGDDRLPVADAAAAALFNGGRLAELYPDLIAPLARGLLSWRLSAALLRATWGRKRNPDEHKTCGGKKVERVAKRAHVAHLFTP